MNDCVPEPEPGQREDEPEKVARGSPESAAWFRSMLVEIGETQGSLAKLMKRGGDDRQLNTILRNMRRMASGQARVSGEMRVLLHFLRQSKTRRARLAAARGVPPEAGTEQPAPP